ncbi:cytochrome P450 [Sphaerisporangium sp. TRM90804]|uniref:cytochrome P450 n=1 Tax=Sphaerisporangium sp. TRM90804 TaxID=3031113 RepID=UPI00244AF477|nr:cytochrome P450 [Sphaerisporangium sp. TRM90804]MDH2429248.1 cytochrome P450 [Sphaerisporangium sp. TRM90804]
MSCCRECSPRNVPILTIQDPPEHERVRRVAHEAALDRPGERRAGPGGSRHRRAPSRHVRIGFFRTATRDTEVGGVGIRQGERVFLSYAAANHDPAKFPPPDDYDVSRVTSATFLDFGHGIHNCAGAPLARVEMRISLELLARRYPRLRLAGEPVRYKAFNQFKTPESLWSLPS